MNPLRRACERCHQYKERCILETGQASCNRCRTLKGVCQFREKRRIGRPPKVNTLDHKYGAYVVFLPSAQKKGTAPRPRHREHAGKTSKERAQAKQNAISILQVGEWQPASEAYGSTSHACVTQETALAPTARRAIPPTPMNLLLSVPRYSEISYFIESRQGFFELHRHFMLGVGFTEGLQLAVRVVLDYAPEILIDAYATVLAMLTRRRCSSAVHNEDELVKTKLAAHCLRQFTTLVASIKQARDAVVAAVLGQLMLVYDSMMHIPSTRPIIAGALLSIKPYLPTLIHEPTVDPLVLPLVLIDTVGCLVRRDIPVVRMPTTERCIVDRFLGLTAPLLTLLYDLCVLSHRCKLEGVRALPTANTEDPYTTIERQISSWKPQVPPDFFSTFGDADAVAILTQASLYRLAAVLVIHRLRYPLGVNDDVAHGYADQILEGLMPLARQPPGGATGLGLDFPLLVAMLERPGPGARVHEAFAPLRFRLGQHGQSALDFVQCVRRAQKSGFQGLWLDLVDEYLPPGFLP